MARKKREEESSGSEYEPESDSEDEVEEEGDASDADGSEDEKPQNSRNPTKKAGRTSSSAPSKKKGASKRADDASGAEGDSSDEEPLAGRKRGRTTPSSASSSKKGADAFAQLSEDDVKKRLTKLAKQLGVKGAGKERAKLYRYLTAAGGDVEAAAERYLDDNPGDAEEEQADGDGDDEAAEAGGKRKWGWWKKGGKKGEKGEKGGRSEKSGKGEKAGKKDKKDKPRGGRVAPYVIPGLRAAGGEPKYAGILDFVVAEGLCRLHGERGCPGFRAKGAAKGLEAWRACGGEPLLRLAHGPLDWVRGRAEDGEGPEPRCPSRKALEAAAALEAKGLVRTTCAVGYHAPTASIIVRVRLSLCPAVFEAHPMKVCDFNLARVFDRLIFDPTRAYVEAIPGTPAAAAGEEARPAKGKGKGKGKAAATAEDDEELRLPEREPRPWALRWPEYHEWRDGLEGAEEHHGDFSIPGVLSRCLASQDLPQAPQPEEHVSVQLRPYQLQSLRWMLEREASPTSLAVEMFWTELALADGQRVYYNPYAGNLKLQDVSTARGGILGEEMGLGKTVELLALVSINRPPASWLQGAPCRPGLVRSNATLIVAPVSLLEQWRLEIQSKCRHPPKVYVFHTGRTKDVAELAGYDIVLTTYSILQREAGDEGNPLEKIEWYRIIADESHYIKYAACAQAKILLRMESPIRWLASGTPIQLHIMDLRSMLKYLRVYPFNVEECWNKCIKTPYEKRIRSGLLSTEHVVRTLCMRHVKAQAASGEALVTLPPRTVELVESEWRTADERLLYERLFPVIRRKFAEIAATDEGLRSKYVDMVACVLALRQACSHLRSLPLVRFSGADEDGALGDPLGVPSGEGGGAPRAAPRSLSLEQILKGLPMADRGREYIRELERALRGHTGGGGSIQCAVCLDPIESPCAIRPCLHLFCTDCVAGLFAAGEKRAHCPSCRRPFTERQLVHIALTEEAAAEAAAAEAAEAAGEAEEAEEADEGEGASSAGRGSPAAGKAGAGRSQRQPELLIPAVMPGDISGDTVERYRRGVFEDGTKLALLFEHLDALWRRDPAAKVVVFTYFSHTFERVVEALVERGIRHSKLCGSMAQKSRARALRLFSGDPGVNVFVLSVRAGAVGLTLTAASHAFILEPCINVGTEEQAINRIHRIGQTREVHVKIFWLRSTIEERILQVRTRLKQAPAAAPESAEAGEAGEGPLLPAGPGWGGCRVAGPAGSLRDDRATDLRVAEWRELFVPFDGEAAPAPPPAPAAPATPPAAADGEAAGEAPQAAAPAEPTVARKRRRGGAAAQGEAAEAAAAPPKSRRKARLGR